MHLRFLLSSAILMSLLPVVVADAADPVASTRTIAAAEAAGCMNDESALDAAPLPRAPMYKRLGRPHVENLIMEWLDGTERRVSGQGGIGGAKGNC